MENQLASKIPTTKIMQNYKIPKKSTLKSIVIVPKRSEETHQIQHYPGSSLKIREVQVQIMQDFPRNKFVECQQWAP